MIGPYIPLATELVKLVAKLLSGKEPTAADLGRVNRLVDAAELKRQARARVRRRRGR